MAGERINNPATKSGCSSVGRTPHLGCGGREFKSHHSDQAVARFGKCSCCGSPFTVWCWASLKTARRGYSAIAKRLRQWSLTPSLVCSNHTRAAKAHNGRSCKSSYKMAVKQLCGSGENHRAVAAFSLKFVLDNHIILW